MGLLICLVCLVFMFMCVFNVYVICEMSFHVGVGGPMGLKGCYCGGVCMRYGDGGSYLSRVNGDM